MSENKKPEHKYSQSIKDDEKPLPGIKTGEQLSPQELHERRWLAVAPKENWPELTYFLKQVPTMDPAHISWTPADRHLFYTWIHWLRAGNLIAASECIDNAKALYPTNAEHFKTFKQEVAAAEQMIIVSWRSDLASMLEHVFDVARGFSADAPLSSISSQTSRSQAMAATDALRQWCEAKIASYPDLSAGVPSVENKARSGRPPKYGDADKARFAEQKREWENSDGAEQLKEFCARKGWDLAEFNRGQSWLRGEAKNAQKPHAQKPRQH